MFRHYADNIGSQLETLAANSAIKGNDEVISAISGLRSELDEFCTAASEICAASKADQPKNAFAQAIGTNPFAGPLVTADAVDLVKQTGALVALINAVAEPPKTQKKKTDWGATKLRFLRAGHTGFNVVNDLLGQVGDPITKIDLSFASGIALLSDERFGSVLEAVGFNAARNAVIGLLPDVAAELHKKPEASLIAAVVGAGVKKAAGKTTGGIASLAERAVNRELDASSRRVLKAMAAALVPQVEALVAAVKDAILQTQLAAAQALIVVAIGKAQAKVSGALDETVVPQLQEAATALFNAIAGKLPKGVLPMPPEFLLEIGKSLLLKMYPAPGSTTDTEGGLDLGDLLGGMLGDVFAGEPEPAEAGETPAEAGSDIIVGGEQPAVAGETPDPAAPSILVGEQQPAGPDSPAAVAPGATDEPAAATEPAVLEPAAPAADSTEPAPRPARRRRTTKTTPATPPAAE